MKRIFGIIATVTVWLAVIGYFVFASDYSLGRTSEVTVDSLCVIVKDAERLSAVTEGTVRSWVARSGVAYKGVECSQVNTGEIKRYIAGRPFVATVAVYTDLSGVLTVEVSQRRPVARVTTATGYDFFLTDDAHILPVVTGAAVYVPVVTGNPLFMQPPGYFGSYENIKQKLIDEYVEASGKLAAQRAEISGDIASARAERAKIAGKRESRFWREKRKEEFRRDNAEKLERIDRRIEDGRSRLLETDEQKISLQDKQKKSAKKYLYLYKLLNFVKFVEDDSFWSSQITQINIVTDATGASVVEIVPRAGNHTVCLGEIDSAEENLAKLMLFYRRGLQWQGWDGYKYIDLRYRNQIVCTK